ncbi:MAG: hypothetical protein JWQ35_1582, partial [Bacteriovoracaceae bacterium]|nr:hypothetical protein [Bacteriovoracaceae bacterium]
KKNNSLRFQAEESPAPTNIHEEQTEEGLNEYVAFLKQSRAQNAVSESKASSKAPLRPSAPIEIELRDEASIPIEEEAAPETFERHALEEEFIEEKKVRARIPSESAKPFKINKVILGASISAGVIIILCILFLGPKPEEPKPDPYLTRLLTPIETQIKTQAALKPPTTPHPVKLVVRSKAPSTLLGKMNLATFNGEFENVVRLGSTAPNLGDEELALFLEALFQRAGNKPTRHAELRQRLEQEKSTHPENSALIRTTALSILLNPSKERSLSKALEILKSLSLTRSNDTLVFAYLGLTYEQMDQLNLAHQAWDESLTLEPGFVWILEKRDNFYRSEKKYPQAMQMAEKISQIAGHELDGQIRLAQISELKEDLNSAANFYRKAIKIQDSAALRLALGEILEDATAEASLREFQAGLKAHPSKSEKRDLYIQIGRTECDLKNYEASSDAFKKALTQDPHAIKISTEKANCELNAGKYKSAAATLEKALKSSPNNAQLWQNYGLSLQHLNKQRAALAALKRSVELKATDSNHLLIAQVLVSMQKKQEATIHLRKAIQLNPKNKKAAALLKSLN